MNAIRKLWLAAALCLALLLSIVSADNVTAQTIDDPAEFALQPMSTAEPMGPKSIFQGVSTAVAFVETPRGSGSGVLVEPGYLVSNAHVVWPYESVRVVFPDGTEIKEVPVVAWDLIADLAIVGPLDVDTEPVTFADGSDLEIGSTVYLIGYPGETEDFPQPTIADGLLSRTRQWDSIGMELLQVDAAVTGGHSGGVLATERGEVIGITTFYFTDAQYALVSSATDVVPRLNALLQEPGIAFNDRRPLQQAATTEMSASLEDSDAMDYFLLDAETGSEVEISVEGVGRPWVAILDVYGSLLAESQGQDEHFQELSVNVEDAVGPYVVVVGQQSPYRNAYTLASSHGVVPCDDPEDGVSLSAGDVYTGSIDVPRDTDTFKLQLEQGQTVAIEADSLMVDSGLVLIYESGVRREAAGASDGEGIFNQNPRVVYHAPADAEYTLLVGGESDIDTGAYRLTITEADEPPDELYDSRTFFISPYGMMEQYESELYGYTVKHPAYWSQVECNEGSTACFDGGTDGALLITDEDLADLPSELRSRTAYVDVTQEMLTANLSGGKLVARSEFTTPQGYTVDVLQFTGQGGLSTLFRFMFVNEAEEWATNFTYLTPTESLAEAQSTIDYVFTTFRIGDEDADLTADPIYHLDEGIRLASEEQNLAAIGELGQAIKHNPELADAYLIRAIVYERMGQLKLAASDLEKALALQPDRVALYNNLGLTLWHAGETERAMEVTDEGLALDPEYGSAYNNRALMYATLGDYASALSDMASFEAVEGELAPYALDSRAYIYLKMEDYEAALADYEELLADDFQHPVTLLGAGVAYARVGDMEKALPLLEYGKQRFVDSEVEHPDPQLADVLAWADEILAVAESAE